MLCRLREAEQGCWGGMEPPSPTLSLSVTSWELWVPEDSRGVPGSVLLSGGGRSGGDSHSGGLSPP